MEIWSYLSSWWINTISILLYLKQYSLSWKSALSYIIIPMYPCQLSYAYPYMAYSFIYFNFNLFFCIFKVCLLCKACSWVCFSIQPDKFCLLIRIFRALTFNIIFGTFGFVCHLFHLFSIIISFSLSLSLCVCLSFLLLSFSSCLSIYPFSAFF